ncbi:MAG: hypothetical protein KDD50_09085 [Bdellovibrionales bacterium]|nr:hypothetical protein [Bdellovibrionales bacterium]
MEVPVKGFKNIFIYVLLVQMVVHPVYANVSGPSSVSQCVQGFNLESEQRERLADHLGGLLTFPIPYRPLKRAFSDKNTRYTIMEKSFILGPFTTAVGVSVARMFTGSEVPWLYNYIDSYVSYTMKDVVAMGVALDSKLSSAKKYWINYGFTAGTYALVTTLTSNTFEPIVKVINGLQTATDAEVSSAAQGLGLVSFALLWPFMSQIINTTVVPPILKNRFPLKTTLEEFDQAKENGTLVDLVIAYRSKYEEAEKSQNGDIKTLRSQYYWVKWMAVGLEPGDYYPFVPKRVNKVTKPLNRKTGPRLIKTAFISLIATSMIAGYFVTRHGVVGSTTEINGITQYDFGILTEQIRDLLFSQKLDESALNSLNDVIQ